MISQKLLHKEVIHHLRKGEFPSAQQAVLRALHLAENEKDKGFLSIYVDEIKYHYAFLLLQDEVKQRYGALLNRDHPTLEQLEEYVGYENSGGETP